MPRPGKVENADRAFVGRSLALRDSMSKSKRPKAAPKPMPKVKRTHYESQIVWLLLSGREEIDKGREVLDKGIAKSVRDLSKKFFEGSLEVMDDRVQQMTSCDYAFADRLRAKVYNVLFQRRFAQQIVDQSSTVGTTRQLEALSSLNQTTKPSNILLLDGNLDVEQPPMTPRRVRANPSFFDPNVRYLCREQGVVSDIRTQEDLLVYLSCILTHGRIQIVTSHEKFTPSTSAVSIMTGFTAAISATQPDNICNFVSETRDQFHKKIGEISKKQQTAGWNRFAKDERMKKQEEDLQKYKLWNVGKSLRISIGGHDLFLSFAATPPFWHRFVMGLRKDAELKGDTQFQELVAREVKWAKPYQGIDHLFYNDITADGSAYYDSDEFKTVFKELPRTKGSVPFEDHGAVFQAHRADGHSALASVEFRVFWFSDSEILDFVHTGYNRMCTKGGTAHYTGINLKALRAMAFLFIKKYILRREEVESRPGYALLRSYERACLFITNMDIGQKAYASNKQHAPLPKGITVDILLPIFDAFLTMYGVSVINLRKNGPAVTTQIIKYVTFELVHSIKNNALHFTTTGM